jgi:hypothetical protein
MTMQAADYVTIGKKIYSLIDIEENKQIIKFADFVMPTHNGENYISSACWRGYMADYYIIKNTLYGIKKQDYYCENTKEHKTIKSPKLFIPYTGSCIIAFGDAWNSDFLSTYIDYDEAFELYFDNGILKEKLSLLSAIDKVKVFAKNDVYNNKIEPYERAIVREYIAREPLKYKYNIRRTYKWRNNIDKKDEYLEYDDTEEEEKIILENILKRINSA